LPYLVGKSDTTGNGTSIRNFLMKKQNIVLKIFVCSAIILGAYSFNRSGLLQSTIQWIENLGPAAPAAFLAVYAIAAVFFLPSFLLTFAGGFLFDFWVAFSLSTLGSGLGAVSAFLIGRYLARAAAEKQALRIRGFAAITALVAKKGWKIVLLARLSPIFPFLIANYAFGTTRMKARHYFFASLAGTIPSALVYTYSGHLAGSLAGMGSRTRTFEEWILLGVGLAASVAITLYLRRLAQAALRDLK
jgi:uncharacterized membrane protein YdjX (TVP38/TMEM64 family)